MERFRALLIDGKLPKQLWAESVSSYQRLDQHDSELVDE